MKSTNGMTRVLYFTFSIGFILFLGSLFSFIVINLTGEEPTVSSIYWQRLFVKKMISVMTVPGLALIVISDVFLCLKKDCPFSKRWMLIAQIIIALLVINSAFFIIPTAYTVNEISLQQLNTGVFFDEYARLKSKEDIVGAVNFLMTIGLLLTIIFRAKR
jgi:hypothetical protein